jgi:hypothetical protein
VTVAVDIDDRRSSIEPSQRMLLDDDNPRVLVPEG